MEDDLIDEDDFIYKKNEKTFSDSLEEED